jgi:hypothetical protein
VRGEFAFVRGGVLSLFLLLVTNRSFRLRRAQRERKLFHKNTNTHKKRTWRMFSQRTCKASLPPFSIPLYFIFISSLFQYKRILNLTKAEKISFLGSVHGGLSVCDLISIHKSQDIAKGLEKRRNK